MTSWASVMKHVTFGLALRKSRKIIRENCAQNAQIPVLGYGAVQEKEESQEAPKLRYSIATSVRHYGPYLRQSQNLAPIFDCK